MKRFGLAVFMILLILSGCAAPATPGAQPTAAATQAPDTPSPAVPTEPAATTEPAVTAEPTQTPADGSEGASGWVAYIGPEENIWLVNPATNEQQQVTQDAAAQMSGEQETIRYCCARWSSDGRLLAYQREVGTPVADGYQFEFGLWVYDVSVGETRPVLENQQTAGFVWKPGTHLITYGLPVDFEYFTSRGEHSAEAALGIWAVDADGGEPYELVKPERGYSLVSPNWSPDGRYLGFDEVQYLEGRGLFAYYDFEAQKYVAWEEVIGSYAWSPDGERIAYDQLAYVATGTERIYLNNLQGSDQQEFSTQLESGYAIHPEFSPQGDQLAYLRGSGEPDDMQYTLIVQPVDNGEPVELGVFEQVYAMDWSPDGERIVLSAGPYEERQVFVVTVADGSAQALAKGFDPAWQPAVP